MKRIISILFATLSWFAIIAQYYLILKISPHSFTEVTVRFFSYFTILTNLLVAIYYTLISIKRQKWVNKPGTLTALTIYIFVVGLVYQFVLRQIWEPQGLQKVVDEFLHSVIPLLTLFYWIAYENKLNLKFGQIPKWLIYPTIYLLYVLLRGEISGFYPYPFIDVSMLGFQAVLINVTALIAIFLILSLIFVIVGLKITRLKVE